MIPQAMRESSNRLIPLTQVHRDLRLSGKTNQSSGVWQSANLAQRHSSRCRCTAINTHGSLPKTPGSDYPTFSCFSVGCPPREESRAKSADGQSGEFHELERVPSSEA